LISIIIPTYNESKNITGLFERIRASLIDGYELIIVDDASPDATGMLAEKLSCEHPVKVLHRSGKLGLASAVLEGFKLASGDLWCVMDSDLSHPPEMIPVLLKTLKEQEADIVIGSRFAKGGSIENWPLKRHIATKIAILSVRPLTPVKDPMSGFFMLKKEVVENVNLIPRGFKILLEILVKGRYEKVIEVPIVFKDRIHGESKVDPKVYLEFSAQLWDLYCHKLKNGH